MKKDYRLTLNELEYVRNIADKIKTLECHVKQENHEDAKIWLDKVIEALENDVFLKNLKELRKEWDT